MAESFPHSPRPPTGPAAEVHLEVRHGTARPLLYAVTDAGFLIGTVTGCDLRLPGIDLPPVLGLIARGQHEVSIRKLVPTVAMTVNGKAVSGAPLTDGDRVMVGPVELLIHVTPPPPAEATLTPPADLVSPAGVVQAELDARAQSLEERQRRLDEQTAELETDRIIWYRRREEMAKEVQQLQDQVRHLTAARADLPAHEEAIQHEREEWERRRQELEAALADQIRQTEATRQEFAALRQEHYDRYRERRDRLAGLQEAVNRAAAKVQENKRQLAAEVAAAAAHRQEDAARRAEVEAQAAEVAARAAELEQAGQRLQEQERLLGEQRQEHQRQLDLHRADLDGRERHLAEGRQQLEKGQAQYQADVLRIDRWAASLDERQKQLHERAQEVDDRFEQLQQGSQELEEQARQLDEWHNKLVAEAERNAQQKAEMQAGQADLAKRAAALEGQQAMLAQLRTRLERMREEVRREDQLLTEQRARQEETEAELRRHVQEVQRLRGEFAVEKGTRDEETRRLDERQAVLDAAVAQLRQMQERLATEEDQLRQRTVALDARAAQQAEEAALLKARSVQIAEMQERLAAERQALREREMALGQAEAAREALQEQLRRRAEELAARQRTLADQDRQHLEAVAQVETERAALERSHQEAQERLGVKQQEIERQTADVARREQSLALHIERMKATGRAVGLARKRLHAQRHDLDTEQQRAAAALVQGRAELETARNQAAELQRQVPEWEALAHAAAEHLTQARDQLRGHLAELHAYARQAQEDLERLRSQVQGEGEQLRQREQVLLRARDEHRLAVAAFRQQLIDWQSKVAEMKRSLHQNESRLVRRQAEVDATSARLAQQAEQLQAQEREVTERREEVDRHLADMQEWYRRKLRELTERYFDDPAAGPTAPGILTLTDEVDPGDRQLGDLLRSLNLVEADTLAALLVEARKQRQSLRQVLLASGCVTLYQLALIEAGDLDGLMLGPVRVMDRLRVTTRETVYRVFDPRRGGETAGSADGYALLRHLAEAEMEDAVHPDEFRQRFAAVARLQHPHLTATREVLDIQGRPAVLQEWVTGLPATDWPALFAVSGVWFRLLCQAALGLHTAHQTGLVHGHLHPSLLVLTGEGILKIGGLGEPLWLALPETLPANAAMKEAEPADDLAALGQIAGAWATAPAKRKGVRAKPLAEPLQAVLQRLAAATPEERYPSAAALLEDLDRVGADVPPNPEAWDRLLHYVRDHVQDGPGLRQSA